MIIGAVASGRVGAAAARRRRGVVRRGVRSPVARAISDRGRAVRAGAVRLSRRGLPHHRRTDEAVRDDFRRRALGACRPSCSFSRRVALVLVVLVRRRASSAGVMRRAVVAAAACLHRRRGDRGDRCAVAAAAIASRASRPAAQVSFILWGWAYSQYPFIIPETLTIRGAAAPMLTLGCCSSGLSVGGMILIPSLRICSRRFARRQRCRAIRMDLCLFIVARSAHARAAE